MKRLSFFFEFFFRIFEKTVYHEQKNLILIRYLLILTQRFLLALIHYLSENKRLRIYVGFKGFFQFLKIRKFNPYEISSHPYTTIHPKLLSTILARIKDQEFLHYFKILFLALCIFECPNFSVLI
jgi:hypothetical protein